MDSTELVVSTTTDSAGVAEAAAKGDEQRSRVPAPKPEVEKLDGSTAVSFEHERSERTLLLERLAQHDADLEALTSPEGDSEQMSSTESAPEEAEIETQAEPENIDMEAVRKAATEDAIAAGRRWAADQQGHIAQPSQADLNQLRAQLAVPFAERMKELRAKASDIAEIDKQSNIPIPMAVQDALLALPGGPEATLYLVRHPSEAHKLRAMPEHLALAKVAQLTARLDPASSRQFVSRAPAPITPVSGSAKSSVPMDQMDYRDFVKLREQQMKNRYRR